MLTHEQVLDAIEQMKVSCDLKQVNYEMCSARGVLNELGFNADVEQILQFIYDGGFTYCLDHWFKCFRANEDPEYPCEDACYWGPDQLKSRLDCLFFPVS